MNCPICKKELEITTKKVGEDASGEAIYNEFAICRDCKKQWNLDKQRAKKDAVASSPKQTAEDPAVSDEAAVVRPRKKKKRPVNSDPISEQTVDGTDSERPRKKRRPPVETTSENGDVTAPRPRKKKRPVNAEISPADELAISLEGLESEMESEPQPRPKKKKRPVSENAKERSEVDRPRKKKNPETEEQTYSNIPPKHVREKREQEMRENYQNMLDEGEDDEAGGFPIVLIIILILLILCAIGFAYYWFFMK